MTRQRMPITLKYFDFFVATLHAPHFTAARSLPAAEGALLDAAAHIYRWFIARSIARHFTRRLPCAMQYLAK